MTHRSFYKKVLGEKVKDIREPDEKKKKLHNKFGDNNYYYQIGFELGGELTKAYIINIFLKLFGLKGVVFS